MDKEVAEPAPEQVTPERAKPDRTLFAVLIVVGLLVVISLVAVLVRGTAHDSLDPKSPEGVVQRYAQAMIDGDYSTAAKYVKGRDEQCDYYESTPVKLRLTFRSTDISGDNATVSVTVTSSYEDGLFGSGEYSTDEQFFLTKSGDGWLITQTPYEFINCYAADGSS